MGGQEIQRSIDGGGRVVLADGKDLVGSLLGGLAFYKIQHGVLKGIVHHTVQPLAQQVGAALPKAELGGGILPHLAQQKLFRADPLDGGADLFNKFIRQLIRYIQPETGSAAAQPGVDHAALAGDELHKGGGLLVDLRQGLKTPPAAVAALVFGVKIVPAAVGGIGVTVGAACAVAPLAVKVPAVGAGMAEHAVQHDADAVLGGFPAEHLKLLVGAQQGVHVQVVGGVVAVVGVCLKDGVQVQVVYTHLLQVGQLDADAFQVAAKIVLVQMAAGLVWLPERLGVLIGLVQPVREGHGLVFDALAEAVWEDLVEHLALDAGRGLEIRLVDRDLPALSRLPAEHAAVICPAHDAAEVGVQVKVVKV